MKHLITLTLLATCLTASAQTLPKEVTIKLTDKQVLRLDSAIRIVSNAIDSKSLTSYLNEATAPLFNQVRKQLVVDKPKEIVKP